MSAETNAELAHEIRERIARKLMERGRPMRGVDAVGVVVGDNLVLVKHAIADRDSSEHWWKPFSEAVDETMEELGVQLWHVL